MVAKKLIPLRPIPDTPEDLVATLDEPLPPVESFKLALRKIGTPEERIEEISRRYSDVLASFQKVIDIAKSN